VGHIRANLQFLKEPIRMWDKQGQSALIDRHDSFDGCTLMADSHLRRNSTVATVGDNAMTLLAL